jgi:hypothetical protein
MAAYAIQFRRGTTTEHSSFTGLLGEVTVDTTKKTVVVHDGSTAGGTPLALDGAAISTTTGAFSSNVTVAGTLAVTSTSTMGGNLTMTGHILPSANVTYDLGSTSMMWRDVFIGPGSLYINGKKVIEDDSGSINITTDNNEDLKFTTTGTGTLKLISGNGINITGELGAVSGDLQIGDHIDMNSSLIKELATPVSSTDAANKAYVDSTAASAVTDGSNAVSGTTGAFSSNLTVDGNLTVSGTTTTVNTTDVVFEDNMFVLNSNTTGTPSENSGFEVERGDSLNVQFLWNETDDRWSTGSNTFHSGAITTPMLTGDVTGDLTGDSAGTHTGAVIGNVTGNLAGDVTGNVTGNTSGSAGTVTSIAAHLLDEDNMASDSATQVPSQQSVKAYVDAQILTEDNTDEIVEGSTNLYFTDARARGAISVSGDISYNSSTGVITTTGLASSDTGDLAEGSNLYYTTARWDTKMAAADTADLTEGTNLYHTTARARAAISASGSLSYDNSTGVMSFTMNDETVQDIVGPMFTSNTETGITVTYDDADGTIDLVVNQSHFHSAVQTVTAAEETDNSTSTTDYTFSDLTNAKHYVIFLNRSMLRPAEYSVSGSTLTIVSGIIALDDELEVTGFTNT